MNYRSLWRKSKPTNSGFTRAYQASTPAGNELTAEFDALKKIVVITCTIPEDRNKLYSSRIQNGSVLRERDVTFNKDYPVQKKFESLREFFSSIPDNPLLDSIGGIYGISRITLPNESKDKTQSEEIPYWVPRRFDEVFGIQRETRFQKWRRLRRERKSRELSLFLRIRRRFLGDLTDVSLGLGAGYLTYNLYWDLELLGFVLAFFGIYSGALDWILRRRKILLTKVLSFVLLGSYAFFIGYTQY